MKKEDRVALERLSILIRTELQGFQIFKYTKETLPGVFTIKMFGIRIKCVDNAMADDQDYRVLYIPDEEHLNRDKLFLELASSGYIFWLRTRYSTHGFLGLLTYDQRGEKLLRAAKALAREEKKGEFRIRYLDNLLRRPLIEIYQEDPAIFDWIML